VTGRYEIVRNVTASKILAGTWERDVTVRLNMSRLFRAPPAEKGCVASNLPNAAFELCLLLGLSS